jgi:hypothetical protein
MRYVSAFFHSHYWEGKAVVLYQQGSCVHLGEVLQCISHQVLSIGQDQCPLKQDLKLSIAHE